MTFKEKLELIQSAIKLAKFWGVEVNELLGFVALMDKDRQKKWNKIAKEVLEFDKMNLEDRAKKLGLTYKKVGVKKRK